MVRVIWLVFALITCMATAALAAEPRFSVQADKKVLALGESLTLEIKVQDPQAALSSIQLDELKLNFEVYTASTSQQSVMIKGREVKAEMMTLTLYPLQSGELTLPSLHYMGKSSKALPLSVLDGSQEIPRVIIKQGVEPALPWVRQAAILYLDIYDDGSLQWTRPADMVVVGAHVRPLADTLSEGMLDGSNYTIHRFAWALTPLRDSGVSVRFPMLDAVKFGTHLRYEAKPFWFYVAPVPAYLPVHVPIGKPEVSIAALPAEILLNRPINWVLTITGSGISEEGLAKLLSTMHDDENWNFYPLTTVPGLVERATSATQTFKFVIPFKAVRAGVMRLPDLNLPYFDPEHGKVETIKIPGPLFKVVNPLWQSVRTIVIGCLIVVGLGGLTYFLWKHIRRAFKKQKSLRNIKQAETAKALIQAMLDYDVGAGKVGGATLQQWLHCMERIYEVDLRLSEIVGLLESERYHTGNHKIGVPDLARETETSIKRLKFKKLSSRRESGALLMPHLFAPDNKEI